MFCTSLRKRPQWESVPSNLLSISTPKWKESSLNTHDIAIPLHRAGEHEHFMRFLLLSATDMNASEEIVKRVERLSLFNGGQHLGIIFLLNEKDMKNGFPAYMQLQTILLTSGLDVSIVPLNSLRSLPSTIFVYQRQMLQAKTTTALITPLDVLPYCSSGGQLHEHTKNVLSDIFHGFAELALAATTADGQQAIREYLPDKAQAEEVIRFWLDDYTVE